MTLQQPLELARAVGLFVVTALAEIVGCYLPYLWLRRDGSPWGPCGPPPDTWARSSDRGS